MEYVNKMVEKQGGSEAVMKKVSSLIESQGGVSGLASKFQSSGLGDKVQSWIGKGPNQPLSGTEVRQALGDQEVDRIAEESGVSSDEAASQLASVLPETVDKLTPNGNIPSAEQVKGALKSLGF